MNFSDLKQKDVINVCDGRRLGRAVDLILNVNACVEALIVPGAPSMWNWLKPDREGIVIPWNRVRRIGDDVILVDIEGEYGD